MKRLLLFTAVTVLCSLTSFGQTTLQVTFGEDGASATPEEMAAVETLEVLGEGNAQNLTLIKEACLLEGSKLRVLDFTSTEFPDKKIPEKAFYVETEDSGEDAARLSLDRIVFGSLNVDAVGAYAFKNVECPEILIPGYLGKIGEEAFADCGVTAFPTPKVYGEIGNGAFSNCLGLTEVRLEDSFFSPLTIGEEAFSGCSNLRTVALGSGVTSIEYDAFEGTAVETLILPMSVETAWLTDMESLREIWSLSPVPPALKIFPEGTDVVAKVCPGSVAKYLSSEGWSSCSNIEEFTSLPEEVEIEPSNFQIKIQGGCLSTVSFNFDGCGHPVINSKMELFEDGKEAPVAVAAVVRDESANCLCVDAEFSYIELTPGKEYHLVIPAGAFSKDGIPNAQFSRLLTYNGSLEGVEIVEGDDIYTTDDRLFDLHGREVYEVVPGQPYIKGGKVFVETK